MAIRPPRRTHKRQSRHQIRDAAAAVIVSGVVLAFGLRMLLAMLGVEPWAVAWEIVAVPTDPLLSLIRSIDLLAKPFVNHLTPADVLAFVLVAFAGLTALASIALRRE